MLDRPGEFCGKPQSHPYELLAAMVAIENRSTKLRSPRTIRAELQSSASP